MGLSARFPLVMPIGRMHHDDKGGYFDLVDGGYFENSAAETLAALVDELSFYQNYLELLGNTDDIRDFLKSVRFRRIVLGEYDKGSDLSGQTLNELLSPILALYRARMQRGAIAINRLYSGADTSIIRISHDPYKLPLGWSLSASRQRFISTLIGAPSDCSENRPRKIIKATEDVAARNPRPNPNAPQAEKDERDRQGRRFATLFYFMYRNSCVLRDVIQDIRTAPAGSSQQASQTPPG
jgi:hypothetical protein